MLLGVSEYSKNNGNTAVISNKNIIIKIVVSACEANRYTTAAFRMT